MVKSEWIWGEEAEVEGFCVIPLNSLLTGNWKECSRKPLDACRGPVAPNSIKLLDTKTTTFVVVGTEGGAVDVVSPSTAQIVKRHSSSDVTMIPEIIEVNPFTISPTVLVGCGGVHRRGQIAVCRNVLNPGEEWPTVACSILSPSLFECPTTPTSCTRGGRMDKKKDSASSSSSPPVPSAQHHYIPLHSFDPLCWIDEALVVKANVSQNGVQMMPDISIMRLVPTVETEAHKRAQLGALHYDVYVPPTGSKHNQPIQDDFRRKQQRAREVEQERQRQSANARAVKTPLTLVEECRFELKTRKGGAFAAIDPTGQQGLAIRTLRVQRVTWTSVVIVALLDVYQMPKNKNSNPPSQTKKKDADPNSGLRIVEQLVVHFELPTGQYSRMDKHHGGGPPLLPVVVPATVIFRQQISAGSINLV